MLGTLELRRVGGDDLNPILRQPKRLALLAYLATAERRYVQRDVLFALFWPDAETHLARNNLRQALHFLRSYLDGAIIIRGEEEVGIDRSQLTCDVAAFAEAVANDQPETAAGLYRGDLLAGFHVTGLSEFEKWLERKRARLRWTRACPRCGLKDNLSSGLWVMPRPRAATPRRAPPRRTRPRAARWL